MDHHDDGLPTLLVVSLTGKTKPLSLLIAREREIDFARQVRTPRCLSACSLSTFRPRNPGLFKSEIGSFFYFKKNPYFLLRPSFMGIGFGSGILLDLVLFADRIIAEPKI